MGENNMDTKIRELLDTLTTEEKATLCAGADFWHTAPLKDRDIPSRLMTDGPHGLRRQQGKKAMGRSYPATCFPAAVTSACSFDRELLRMEGAAIGAEARAQGVSLVLGPGLNIKRHPFCGRNFEYFSEDPFVAGELAAAWVQGIQSRGVGACLKHFACNSQEAGRMISDSVLDERTLREIYLAGFETAIKKSAPMAIMGAYNKINGVYACENATLLTDILRSEWGFEGMVVTDWGALNDITAAIPAGLDLEMPASGGERTARLAAAVESGKVSMDALDRAAGNILRFIFSATDSESEPFDPAEHHELARRIARESAVLIKNRGLLPLSPQTPVTLINAFGGDGDIPIQGEGSSQVSPTELTGPRAAMEERGIQFLFCDGKSYDEAAIAARAGRAAILFAGIPAAEESEGFDRTTLSLPPEQNRLIETVLDANPNTVVVLMAGGVVELPWAEKAGAILYMGLGGQAVGGAAVDLIFGDCCPSGRLAETWPLKVTDCPAHPHFGRTDTVEYRESVFVGYRYYNTADTPVAYPFGHGLSYTDFSYSEAAFDTETMTAYVTVTNTGSRAGHEVVQLYIAPPMGILFRPAMELKGFEKIWLAPGESRTVSFRLGERDFAFRNNRTHEWCVLSGAYELRFATSSRDIRDRVTVTLERPVPEIENYMTNTPAYYAPAKGGTLSVPGWQFEQLLGRRVHTEKTAAITLNSTLTDARDIPLARTILKVLRRTMGGESAMANAMIAEMPFRAFTMGGLRLSTVEKLVAKLNESRDKSQTPFSLKNFAAETLSRVKDRAAGKTETDEAVSAGEEELPQELPTPQEDAPAPAAESALPQAEAGHAGEEIPEERPRRRKPAIRLPRKKEKETADTERT